VCRVKKKLYSGFSISGKKIELKRCVVKEAYQADVISPDLQQRQCLQALPRNLTPLPASMPSQKNLTMHLQYLQKKVFWMKK
jgi:hypothetical protein